MKDKKQKLFILNVTEEQYQDIIKKASMYGLSRSSYIKMMISKFLNQEEGK